MSATAYSQRLSGALPVGPVRPGVALVLVMGAVAVVFVVGLGLLAGLPAGAGAATNLAQRDATACLAESGLVEALNRLETLSADEEPTWSVTGRRITGIDGTYDVAVTQPGDYDEDVYLITATGHYTVGDAVVSNTIAMDVRYQPEQGGGFAVRHAALVGSGGVIPASARIEGDVHVNDTVISVGRIEGRLSSSRLAIDLVRGADSTQSWAGTTELPVVDFDGYSQYLLAGNAGVADVYEPDDLPDRLNNWRPADDGNPMGVVVIDGDWTLDDDVKLHDGILVVRGDLDLNGHALEVQGVERQMTVLVEGNLAFSRSHSRLRVKSGLAYIKGWMISSYAQRNLELRADAGLITPGTLPTVFNGDIRVRMSGLDDADEVGVGFAGSGGGGGSASEGGVTPLSIRLSSH